MEKKVYRKVTARELREIVRMATEWKRYKQIAEALGISVARVGNMIVYYNLSKEIKESRLLQVHEYLKTHTYLQAYMRFGCGSSYCLKAKRFGSRETMPTKKAKPKDGQPTKEERIRTIKESLKRVNKLKREKA